MTGVWYDRAERLLEKALDAMRDDSAPIDDVVGSASLALACINVADGTLAEDEFAGYTFPGEKPDESACICPPELVERGGFRSRCSIHGRRP